MVVFALPCGPWPELVDIPGIAQGTPAGYPRRLRACSSPDVCCDPALGRRTGAADRELACGMVSSCHFRRDVPFADSPGRADDVRVPRRRLPRLYARDRSAFSAFALIASQTHHSTLEATHRPQGHPGAPICNAPHG